jgi:WD40 repeat protein
MKSLGLCLLLFLFFCALAPAEEPILVIDPQGHSSQISQLLFTPEGKTLISTSWDKTIRLWDVETGELITTLRHQIGEGHEGEIHAAALSPDGTILAIGGISYGSGDEGVPVFVFDLASGEIIGLLKGHTELVNALDFSPDGKWLASGSDDNTIRIWDLTPIPSPEKRGKTPNTPRPLGEGMGVRVLESDSHVFDLAFAPDGRHIVSGHVDHKVRLWELPQDPTDSANVSGLQPKIVFQKHTNVPSCVDYSPDGKYIASGDFDGNYFLWESQTGKVKKQFPPADTSAAVAFAPDSKTVLISNGNKAVIYSVPQGKELITFTKHVSPVENTAFSNTVTAAAFYGNNLVATAGGNDYDIYIWDVKTGTVKTQITGQGKRVEAVAFGPDWQVALGNTSRGLHNAGPLERSFDFAEMVFNHKSPREREFIRMQTTYQGKTLEYKFGNWYELKIKGGGAIQTSPSDGWVRSYSFTSDGHVVVGSSSRLKLHRSDDGAIIREFIGHTGEVWAVSLSRDGKTLASASDDQTIKLWNLQTGECLATLFIARDGEWVCWTPQGYYAASAGGEQYIGWQVNQGIDYAAKFYPVSVFRKQFYQPDIVKRTIALGSAEQALTELNVRPTAVLQVLPPKVEWLFPQEPVLETSQPTIRIRANIRSDRDLTTVRIIVNGRVQAAGRGLAVGGSETAQPENMIDQEVPLNPGKNEIAIFAANRDSGALSETRLVQYAAETLKPNLYLVSIGISRYQQSDLQLTYADDDAKAISRLFWAQKGKLYQNITRQEFYDQNATKQNIIQAIEWLKKKATQHDVVILFIAAHGHNKQGQYYLLPADGDPARLEHTGVSWKTFSDNLGNVPSRVLLLLDTCHSGQLGRDLSVQPQQVDNTEAIRELASNEYGIVILAASTGREFSLEHPDWGHGAFTKALIEGLEQGKADYSGDGVIDLREMDLYVAERVEVLTQGEQHPTTQKPSTISRFPIVQMR